MDRPGSTLRRRRWLAAVDRSFGSSRSVLCGGKPAVGAARLSQIARRRRRHCDDVMVIERDLCVCACGGALDSGHVIVAIVSAIPGSVVYMLIENFIDEEIRCLQRLTACVR